LRAGEYRAIEEWRSYRHDKSRLPQAPGIDDNCEADCRAWFRITEKRRYDPRLTPV